MYCFVVSPAHLGSIPFRSLLVHVIYSPHITTVLTVCAAVVSWPTDCLNIASKHWCYLPLMKFVLKFPWAGLFHAIGFLAHSQPTDSLNVDTLSWQRMLSIYQNNFSHFNHNKTNNNNKRFVRSTFVLLLLLLLRMKIIWTFELC